MSADPARHPRPRLLVAATVALLAAPLAAQRAPSAVRPPNVLLIAIDDLRPSFGHLGVPDARTPALDALAAAGVSFRNHYAQVPTCGASRYAMLTGRSPLRSGVRAGNAGFRREGSRLQRTPRRGAQTFPELFRRAGYRSVGIGKISHTPDGRLFAYDGSGDGAVELPGAWDRLDTPVGDWGYGWGAFFAYAGGRHREDGQGHRDLMEFVAERDEALPDGLLAAAAVERLHALAARPEPFLLAVGFYKPHLPHVATRADWQAFAEVDVQQPPAPERPESPYWHRSGEYYRYELPFPATRPLAPADRQTARRAYLACVRYADRQVGRLLRALDELALTEDTVVVVWGDHGWHLGERAIWGKHSPFEQSARSALIVRGPGVQRGVVSDALAASIDLYPTLLDLCDPGYERTAWPLDGVSQAPVLRGERDAVRELVTTWNGRVESARSPTHRLILRRGDDGEPTGIELYDFRPGADPFRDVAAEQPEERRALLNRWAQRRGRR